MAGLACGNGRISICSFDTHIHPGYAGYVREIQAGPPRGTPRCVDWRNVIVDLAIRVESKPLTYERQTVRKVERPKTRAGIVAPIFLCLTGRGETEEAFQKRVDGDRTMAFSSPDRCTLESEFKCLGRPEGDLFYVDPGVAGTGHIWNWALSGRGRIRGVGNIRVPLQWPDDELVAKRSGDIRQAGNA